jgi:hypothetical protein
MEKRGFESDLNISSSFKEIKEKLLSEIDDGEEQREGGREEEGEVRFELAGGIVVLEIEYDDDLEIVSDV